MPKFFEPRVVFESLGLKQIREIVFIPREAAYKERGRGGGIDR